MRRNPPYLFLTVVVGMLFVIGLCASDHYPAITILCFALTVLVGLIFV